MCFLSTSQCGANYVPFKKVSGDVCSHADACLVSISCVVVQSHRSLIESFVPYHTIPYHTIPYLADLGRLVILYAYGGAYVDVDVIIKSPKFTIGMLFSYITLQCDSSM